MLPPDGVDTCQGRRLPLFCRDRTKIWIPALSAPGWALCKTPELV